MGIEVRHDGGPASLAGVATAIGQGQAATRNNAIDEERARFLLGLRENQRQFDVNTALRVRAEDINQRQYQTNLAMQDGRQQALLANNQINRQAQLASQQMREEYNLYGQQQAQQFEWQSQGAKPLEQQVTETLKSVQQMKLNPEGQRIRNEKLGRLREVQGMRGQVRPDVYNQFLAQAMDDFQQASLDAYVEHEPSAEEKVYGGIVPLQGQQVVPGQPLPPGKYRSLKGTRNGVDSWEMIDIPEPPSPTFAEDVAKNHAPAPDGGVFLRQPDGKITHIPPVKPEKAAEAKPVDTSKYIKEAIGQLRADHQSSQATGPFEAKPDAIKAKALELMALEKELEAEMAGGSESGGRGDSIIQGLPDLFNAKRPKTMQEVGAIDPGEVFFWNGQYAEMNDDGTVTVIQ